MRSRKVYITDPNEEFRVALAEALSPEFQVEASGDGAEALSRIRQWEPDIVVSELLLENMDGIELLQRLEHLPKPPRMMVITSMNTQFIQAVLPQINIQYAMMKPCIPGTAAKRVREIARSIDADSPCSRVTKLLMELELPNGRDGFAYLQTALPLLMLQRDRRLSKELYEEIAEIHSSTSIRVEKAIRDVLHAGWELGDRAVWQQYFPGAQRCPRNKDFLFRLTDILAQQSGRDEQCLSFSA